MVRPCQMAASPPADQCQHPDRHRSSSARLVDGSDVPCLSAVLGNGAVLQREMNAPSRSWDRRRSRIETPSTKSDLRNPPAWAHPWDRNFGMPGMNSFSAPVFNRRGEITFTLTVFGDEETFDSIGTASSPSSRRHGASALPSTRLRSQNGGNGDLVVMLIVNGSQDPTRNGRKT